ncbi:RNase Sy, partial [Mucor mucedo]|uniref:RNase Sy n=1 Tax=Mucor mucedo TaxID=29922 RepID=UPI002220D3E3
ANTLSCQSTTVDSCCSPTNGLVVLALQWIVGYGPSDEFTVHGLWPDTCEGKQLGSTGCDASRIYTDAGTRVKAANSALYTRMNTYWPSYKDDNNLFWSHEWSKHGTCVTTLDPDCYGTSYTANKDLVDYFSKALDLRDEFDLYAALKASSIVPGKAYPVETIRTAISKAYGASVKLDCTSKKLTEVALNFYVRGKDSYEITDVLSAGSCSGSVTFPVKY